VEQVGCVRSSATKNVVEELHMAGRVFTWVLLLLLLIGHALEERASAQMARASANAPVQTSTAVAVAVDTTLGGALRSLASRAGVVFVGQVVSVVRKAGVVEVRFAVEQTVMGSVGDTYTLREWAGLWTGGQQRYRVGQRAMFFFHAAKGEAGLSSPVDGAEGVLPLVPMGTDAVPLLDVRRLATRVLRAPGQPMTGDAIGLPEARQVVAEWRTSKSEPVQVALPRGVRPVAVISGILGGADDARR
jgi:hypothetical protein